MTGSIDKTGIPTTNSNSSNDYSVELTDYVYHKMSNINVGDDFTNDEIVEHELSVSNDKIDISTTGKLIKYLKAFIKVRTKNITNKLDISTYNSHVSFINAEIERLETAIADVESDILDKMYPVGSVYMTFESTNPNTVLGGSWIKIEDSFLLGSGSKNVDSTGGEENHTLTISELPSHNHTQERHYHGAFGADSYTDPQYLLSTDKADFRTSKSGRPLPEGSGDHFIMYTNDPSLILDRSYTGYARPLINNTGDGIAHNNMPPYRVVHMWRRVS